MGICLAVFGLKCVKNPLYKFWCVWGWGSRFGWSGGDWMSRIRWGRGGGPEPRTEHPKLSLQLGKPRNLRSQIWKVFWLVFALPKLPNLATESTLPKFATGPTLPKLANGPTRDCAALVNVSTPCPSCPSWPRSRLWLSLPLGPRCPGWPMAPSAIAQRWPRGTRGIGQSKISVFRPPFENPRLERDLRVRNLVAILSDYRKNPKFLNFRK
jgi:hypothetical protein